MAEHYCTYFDRNYLIKALALFDSLNACETREFTIYAVCMDEISRVVLEELRVPNVVPVPLHHIEDGDPALQAAKLDRSVVEYYWTTTPSVILWLLDRHPEIDVLSYVDSDIYFFGSPKPIRKALGSGSVLIHEHRFSPGLEHLVKNGKYNVGLVTCKNDAPGREVIGWWRDRCIEWCRDELVAGKFGDQKYLDDWVDRFDCVRELKNIGCGVAPWNHAQYSFRQDADQVIVNGGALVFYHFHSLVTAHPAIIVPAKHMPYELDADVIRICFLPYIRALSETRQRVIDALPGFPFGQFNQDVLTPTNTLVARKTVVEELIAVGLRGPSFALDDDWVCFPQHQFRSTASFEKLI